MAILDADLKQKTVQQMAAEPASNLAGALPVYATADLPDAAAMGAGFQVYDSTVQAILVSNGTSWEASSVPDASWDEEYLDDKVEDAALTEALLTAKVEDGALTEDLLADKVADGALTTALLDAKLASDVLVVSTFTSDPILFSDLGSGASDVIAIAGFPTGVFVLGADAVILDMFEGEADLAVILGDTADDNGYIASLDLDQVVEGAPAIVSGALCGFAYEADLSGDGLAATFSATELDDVTAGSIQFRIYYIQPKAV